MAEKITLELAIETGKSAKNLGQLEEAAENLKDLLKKTDFGTKEFNDLNQALKDVNREIKNTELNMEALDNEQVASELGSVAGAVGDVTAAFILLGGDEDSAMAETARRIETALGVTMAFKGSIEGVISFQKLWNNTLKKTALVQGIYNAGQKAMAFVTNGTTVATKALRLAMLSLPFVAIAAAVTALAMNFKKIMKSFGFFNERAEALKSTFDAFKSGAASANEEVAKMESNFEMAKKGVISKEQALFNYNKTFGKTLGTATDLNEAEEIFVKKSDAYIQAAGLRAQADALFAKAAEKSADAMVAHMESNLEVTDNLSAGITGAIFGAHAAVEQTTKAQDKRTKERQKLLTEQSDLFTKMAKEMMVDAQNLENEMQITSESTNEFEENLETKRVERAKARADRKKKEAEDEKRRLEEHRKYLQNLEKLEDDFKTELEAETEKFNQQFLTEQEIEERAVKDKYFRLTEMAKEYGQSITLLETNREIALAEIRKKFSDQAQADIDIDNDKTKEKSKELNQALIESNQALQDAKLGAAKGLIAGLQQVAGQNEKFANALFIADKALAIGEIIVNLQREVSAYRANPTWSLAPDGGTIVKTGFITAARIRAATSIATIVASSIAKFKNGGGGAIAGGGGGGVPGSGSAPSLQPVTNTSTLVPQDPQQVFVTETDITNTQNKVAVIEDQATIQ
jgi:hypothetical protein